MQKNWLLMKVLFFVICVKMKDTLIGKIILS